MQVSDLVNNIDKYSVIDLRAPIEYEKGHIKGAINVPLFDDEARKLVGTLYKHNRDDAYKVGYEIGEGMIPEIYKKLKSLNKPIVIYCARGGMRSSSVQMALENMGLSVYKLEGGYKDYRTYILRNLDELIDNTDLVVITGNTGSGKTLLLNKLLNNKVAVIDLEGLAKHRGSVFGKIGITEKISQRDFEDEIFYELRKHKNADYIFVESESRKIGDLFIPRKLYERMNKSKHILLNINLNERVKIIMDEYQGINLDKDLIKNILVNNHFFKLRMGREWIKQMNEYLDSNQLALFVEKMLIDYYDKLYQNSHNHYNYEITINADTVDDAYEQLKSYINKQ